MQKIHSHPGLEKKLGVPEGHIIIDKKFLDMVYTAEQIEKMLWLPCCHTTGMHDPSHYSLRKYICDSQKAEALERFCKEIGINPKTKSDPNCGWCFEDNGKPTKPYEGHRSIEGEGMKLFDKRRKY